MTFLVKPIATHLNFFHCGQVCGVEDLKAFKYHFLTPYQPSRARCSAEELESGIAKLKEQLKDAEAEYEKIRKGKNQV